MADEEPEQGGGRRARSVVEGGGELLGAAAGGVLGGPFGVVGGAVAGAAVSRTLQAVGGEIVERVIARRAKARVETAGRIIAADSAGLLASGSKVRADGFFRADGSRISSAEEVLEGLLLHVADSYEEQKIRHLAAVFPVAATDESVSAADAHWVSRTVSRLSWRQLGVLAVMIDGPREPNAPNERADAPSTASPSLREEVQELAEVGLLAVAGSSGMVRAGGTYNSMTSIWGVPADSWGLTQAGQLLASCARLADIDPALQLQLCRGIGLSTSSAETAADV